MNHNSQITAALLDWLSDGAAFGILVTDADMTVLYANAFMRRSIGSMKDALIRGNLFATFPEIVDRGLGRYYAEALAGQVRVLSHRFHKYLIPMPPALKRGDFEHMQQSCTIAPFKSGDDIIGTVSVIEDVTERVALERELNQRIAEGQRLLASEVAAREMAEEINRINGILMTEGAEMLQTRRMRDLFMHKIIAAQEEERRRIARDIHDNLGQQMTALRFAMARLNSSDISDPNVLDQIHTVESIATQLDREVNFLARRVRPSLIDHLGLQAALQGFIDEWSHHAGVKAEFYCYGMGEVRLEPDVEINLYRIAQEALNNISKHAKAEVATVLLENRENELVLIVEDNGKGFVTKGKRSAKDGLGLFSMKERCSLIGALLEIESKPGQGTTVYIRLEVTGGAAAAPDAALSA